MHLTASFRPLFNWFFGLKLIIHAFDTQSCDSLLWQFDLFSSFRCDPTHVIVIQIGRVRCSWRLEDSCLCCYLLSRPIEKSLAENKTLALWLWKTPERSSTGLLNSFEYLSYRAIASFSKVVSMFTHLQR